MLGQRLWIIIRRTRQVFNISAKSKITIVALHHRDLLQTQPWAGFSHTLIIPNQDERRDR